MKNTSKKPDLILPDTAKTLDGLFRERVRRTPDGVAYRQYDNTSASWVDISWQEMDGLICKWRAALTSESLQSGDRVAVMMRNCHEWVAFEQAALSLGLVVVPLYPNDRPDNAAYIINDAGVKLLLIEGNEQWIELHSSLAACSSLLRIIMLESIISNDNDSRLASVDEWLPEQGVSYIHENHPGDLATIVYTSGTTGHSKGVMLSHYNILWNAWSGMQSITVYPNDLFLSFLPLSHTLERTIGYYIPVMVGSTVAYARSIPQLGEDLLSIRPTILISVPRIFERVYTKISAQLDMKPAIARKLFNMAVESGWRCFQVQQGQAHWHPKQLLRPLLSAIVARKIINKLGGRMRFAICGGAPLSSSIAKIFIGLGLQIAQGYGLTETSPVISVNKLEDNDPASVGLPILNVQVKIDDNGELLANSPGIMLGYWNNPEATAATIDDHGWLHTGDKVEIRNDHIYITGRLKDILVLANGEKVPPVDMEAALNDDSLIEQSMVLGEGKSYLSALIVVNPESWTTFVARLTGNTDSKAALDDSRIHEAMLKRISELLHDFPGYAQIRKIALTDQDWNVQNGLMTPTLKIRRNRIMKSYAAEIERLYEGH